MGGSSSQPQAASSPEEETVVQHEDFSHRIKEGVLDSINSLWHAREHTDFIVNVDNSQIHCHRFLLCACSGYFAGLLRSGLQEIHSVTFNSFSKATFESILEALYTGKDVVDSSNVISVWLACHELHIGFLVDVCEEFILKQLTVQNIGRMYKNALITGSEKILQATFEMMQRHFDVFKNDAAFLELTFDNLLKLIDSPDLVVTTEDTVVDAVLEWVRCDTQPPAVNRKEYLGKLLSTARLAFVSPDCIAMLMASEVVGEHKDAKEVLDRAIVYQLQRGQRHGQWPSSALHRKNRDLGNMVVAGYADGRMSVLQVTDLKRWHHFTAFPGFSASYITLTAFDNTLYAFASPWSSCLLQSGRFVYNKQSEVDFSSLQNHANKQIKACGQLFILKESQWQKVADVTGTEHVLVSHGDSIYFFHPVTKKVQRLDLPFKRMTAKALDSVPANGLIGSAFAFEKSILVFCQEAENSTATTVCCLDTVLGTWSRLDKLQDHADVVSFRDDKSTYLLQGSGAVHKVISTCSGQENFKFIGKLWDFQWQVCGCVSVRNTLIICGSQLESGPEIAAVENDEVMFVDHGGNACLTGVFESVQYISGRFDYFQPIILSKNIRFG